MHDRPGGQSNVALHACPAVAATPARQTWRPHHATAAMYTFLTLLKRATNQPLRFRFPETDSCFTNVSELADAVSPEKRLRLGLPGSLR